MLVEEPVVLAMARVLVMEQVKEGVAPTIMAITKDTIKVTVAETIMVITKDTAIATMDIIKVMVLIHHQGIPPQTIHLQQSRQLHQENLLIQ